MRVIVLGAGVAGVTTAYFLALQGHEVRVIERQAGAANECSAANGGQLSYSHVETWAEGGSFRSMFKAAFLPNSFVSLTNLFDKDFYKWLYHFFLNSTKKNSLKNAKNLFEISAYSKEMLQQILGREDVKFNYSKGGILHFYRSAKTLTKALAKLDSYEFLRDKVKILTAEECVEKEPTLVKLFDNKKLAGGILYDFDASGDCFEFTRQLAEICRKKYGVVFEYKTNVKNILTNRKKITGINTDKGVFAADNYVCALGAFGNKLLKGIEVETNIYPVKGYSLSIEANEDFIAPKMALTDVENKIVYSRIGDVFRAAGTVEIAGFSEKINQNNIKFINKKINQTFSDHGNLNQVTSWSGFRPFRPNSIPLICRVEKYGNLFLNMGHGSLGFTLSFASAKIINDLIAGVDDKKFDFLNILL